MADSNDTATSGSASGATSGSRKYGNASDMPRELFGLLTQTIITQWNCEYWGGMNYLQCIQLAPTLAERKTVARIGMEELGHAFILESGPLKVLGVNPWIQRALSVQYQANILKIFQFPDRFTTWAHFLMYNHLQDRSAAIQLAEFRGGPFEPWNDAIRKIEAEEGGHIQYGENGIRELARTPEGRADLHFALRDWLPLALDAFGVPDEQSRSLALYRRYGLKKSNNEARRRFKEEIRPLLDEIGLRHPLLENPA